MSKKLISCFLELDNVLSEASGSQADNSVLANNKDEIFKSSFTKKREAKASEADRRHKEKMQRLDRFNDIFEKMVDKMPD